MTHTARIEEAANLFHLVQDHSGLTPPGWLFQIVLSLIGEPGALQAAECGRKATETETRWTVLGRTARALVYVDVYGERKDWDWDNDDDDTTRHIDAAWIRPLADIAEVRVCGLTSYASRLSPFGQATHWNWKPAYEVVVGDRVAAVPDLWRGASGPHREARREFVADLLARLGS